MATKDQVLALHFKNPHWNSEDIAEALGCESGYVRATARRQGITLAKRPSLSMRAEQARRLAEAVDALLELDADSPPLAVTMAHRNAERALAFYKGEGRHG